MKQRLRLSTELINDAFNLIVDSSNNTPPGVKLICDLEDENGTFLKKVAVQAFVDASGYYVFEWIP